MAAGQGQSLTTEYKQGAIVEGPALQGRPTDPSGDIERATTGVTIRRLISEVDGAGSYTLDIFEMEPNGHNERYLKTKREKLNHVFEKF